MRKLLLLVISTTLFLSSCKKSNPDYAKVASNAEFLRKAQGKVTEVIVHDIFSPVVASRIYAYSCLAAYEAAIPADSSYRSMAGQLKGFEAVPAPPSEQEINYSVASTYAFLKIGKALTFSADMYPDFDKKLKEDYEATGIPSDVYENSIKYGEEVAEHVLNYSKKDNYKQTRGFRHTVTNQEGTWTPTPPAYMDAVEPLWKKIRTFVIDSAAQFKPVEPYPYDMTNKNSPYYKQVMEAYNTIKNLTDEQREIANFWDCNPFKMNVTGHAMFATKKISPGGHWMSIVSQVTRQQKSNNVQTAEAYLLTALTIFDGFVSCWTAKYASIMVRPETVINAKVDKDWVPTLQTPPFPEYTSGHSTISGAAEVSLSSLYGNNFTFIDSTEVQFGLPVRKFESFGQAAEQASISRLYGGIHFRQALDEGLKNGRAIAKHILEKVKTRK
jgi:hypothetical protein